MGSLAAKADRLPDGSTHLPGHAARRASCLETAKLAVRCWVEVRGAGGEGRGARDHPAAATAAPPPVAAAPAPGATNTAARGAEITKPYVATPKDGKGPNILMGEAGLETVVPNNKIKAESVGEQPFQRPPIQSKPPENVEPTKQSPPQNGMTSYSSEQPTTQVLMDHPIPNNSMLYALIEANGNEIGSVHILNNGYFLHSFGFA